MSKTRTPYAPGTICTADRHQRGPGLVTVLGTLHEPDRYGGRIYRVRDHEDGGEYPILESSLRRVKETP